jgi:hypothetical protein
MARKIWKCDFKDCDEIAQWYRYYKGKPWKFCTKHETEFARHNWGRRVDFSDLTEEDIDVTVDVGVHNELKTTIPPSFIARLRTFFAIMAESDPRRQYLAVPKLRKLAKEKTAGKEFEILSELESLFLPMTFCKYVAVKEDFHYSNCYKSKECFELPIDVIPKRMNVISRADLTLDKPTAKGILVYNSTLFMDAIKKILSEK